MDAAAEQQPASPGTASHDAARGFHDIKPLPLFSPVPAPVLWGGVLVLVFVVGLILGRLFSRRGKAATAAAESPDAVASKELERIEALCRRRELGVRELGTRLSLVVRQYLEAAFGFPAAEQTAAEVLAALPGVLGSKLPMVPREASANRLEVLRVLLKHCERMTFDDQSERSYVVDSDQIRSLFVDARQSVDELSAWIKREEDRRRTVIDSAKEARA